MRYFILLLMISAGQAHLLTLDIPAPEYQILNGDICVENGAYINADGAPNLPCRRLTIALPPGAIVESVEFSGLRTKIGTLDIPPAQPPLPMCNENAINTIQRSYEMHKSSFYDVNELYPNKYGLLLSGGGLRKYTLISVACFHFSYRPLSRELYYAPRINVQINYHMPAPGSARAQFHNDLLNDITYDKVAEEKIYNWNHAQMWYHTDTPQRANGYYIILPQVLQNSVDTLVAHRQNQGYDVNVVTTEYIEANMPGDDLPQKIRNYLRQNMVDIEYVLFVGSMADTPWRLITPWNNDPDGPYNDPDFSPIPSDLYFAELTDHDTLSWNTDRDVYYGEVYDSLTQPNGEDNPDYHADIRVGRIPFSTVNVIEDICAKTVTFDNNTDLSYKTASLLAGGMIFFENQNYSGRPRIDGGDDMEQLIIDSILPRSNAYCLYEKIGLRACPHPCTDSLTRNSMISYWNNRGIVYEFNHGMPDAYYRTVWLWDDGDSVPESPEMQSPLCLYKTDAFQLDNDHPATTFLRSCLCGKPETTGLGPHLLAYGSSVVICNTRVGWVSLNDRWGVVYHFLDRLMKDTTSSQGVVGAAYDLARNDFMDTTMFWMPAFHHNLFGDPALRQFGRIVGIEEFQERKEISKFTVYPNPTSGQLTIQLNSGHKREVELDVYDESGRFVRHLYSGSVKKGTKEVLAKLSNGVYFVRLKDGDNIAFRKLVVINR